MFFFTFRVKDQGLIDPKRFGDDNIAGCLIPVNAPACRAKTAETTQSKSGDTLLKTQNIKYAEAGGHKRTKN